MEKTDQKHTKKRYLYKPKHLMQLSEKLNEKVNKKSLFTEIFQKVFKEKS